MPQQAGCSSRRRFLQSSGLLTSGLLLSQHLPGATQKQPNILWISAEDISADLGCYGDVYATSPNIDKLATEGARFTRCFSVSGVCAPSRSTIITGMYQTTIGTMHMRSRAVPPPEVHCFPEYIRAAGYYCTNNVKTDYQFEAPFTAWDESSDEAHWRGREKDQPFFAVFNLTVSHESSIRMPDKRQERGGDRVPPQMRHDPAQAELPPYYPDTPLVRKDWAMYHDNITAMDMQVADILQQLEDDGLADDTIVFFWGDHGRGLPRAKRWIYDSGIHVPLVVRWPGVLEPESTADDLVSFVDFGPTVLSLAGVDVPSHMQGRPFLGDQKATPREYIYASRDRMDEAYDLIRAVRDKRYKYLRNYMPEVTYAQHINYMDEMPTMKEWRRLHAEGKLEGPQKIFFSETKPVEELYDTQADPHEVNNLADSPEHQEILLRLRAEHERWRRDTNDLGLIPEPELMERMRPGSKYETTATPEIVQDGASVKITCATEGASIGLHHRARRQSSLAALQRRVEPQTRNHSTRQSHPHRLPRECGSGRGNTIGVILNGVRHGT